MLSQTLKRLRENSGYTQQQVADALNLERSTYTYYETGKTTPDINTIIKLSKIFNVPYTEIFEDEERNLNSKFNDSYDFYEKQDFLHIYQLSKNEKALISLYRVLPDEEKKEIVDLMKEKVNVISEKRK